jgi:hypothetical protein
MLVTHFNLQTTGGEFLANDIGIFDVTLKNDCAPLVINLPG